jgi:ribosomal protein S18 acetylase RimI-like enzyme
MMAEHEPGRDGRAVVDVQLLSPKDWRVVRDTRLAALRDTPQAFLPKRPPEPTWTEDQWRHSCATSQWAVAQVDGSVVGLAQLTQGGIGPHLESVWTHPDYRRHGIASELVRRLVELERAQGSWTVFVWVIAPNPAAFKLYESLGFEPTHERHLLENLGIVEERLQFSGETRKE